MQPDSPDSPANPPQEPPLVVQGVNTLLVVGAVIWAIGLFTATRHLLEGINAGETGLALVQDVRVVVQRLVLCVAAAFAFVAMRRRRPIGRWIAVVLGSVTSLLTIPSLLYAIRAVNGDMAAPAGMFEYSSPTEARGALAGSVVLMTAQVALTFQLARSKAVDRYFLSRNR